MKKFDTKSMLNRPTGFALSSMGLVVLYFLIMLSFGLIMLGYMGKQSREKAVDTAETVLHSVQSSIRILIEGRKTVVERLAGTPELISLVKEQLKAPRAKRALRNSPALPKLRRLLFKDMDAHGFIGFFLIAPDYTNIASQRNGNVGTQNLISIQREELLRKVFEGESRFVPPIYSDVPLIDGKGKEREGLPTMFIASPVKDESGEVIAVLTGRISTEDDFKLLGQGGRISSTSECYFFDETGRLLSESRYEKQLRDIGLIGPDEDSVFNIVLRDPGSNLIKGETPRKTRDEMPLTFMARSATKGESGRNEEAYNDYRGVPVLGAWLWDNELGVGMASEIDLAEVLAATSQTQTIFVGIMVVSTLLALGLVLAMLEIRKRAERQLSGLESAVENAAEAVLITRPDGLVRYVNPACENILGYGAEDLIGNAPSILSKEMEEQATSKEIWSTLKSGSSWSGRLTAKKKDGSSINLGSTISPIFSPNKTLLGYVLVQRDETNQMKLEETIRQSQKMQAMGTLAGGIAHDFNNLLSGIRGHTELALGLADTGSKQSEYLQMTLYASERAADLVKQILSYSRKGDGKWERINLENVLQSSVGLLHRTLPSSVELNLTVDAAQPVILSDQTRLQQVLLNLCSNAADSMNGEGGRIEVKLSDCPADAEFTARHLLKGTGAYLKLTVRDTGSGIESSVLDQIFDPFFTTKEAGRGTGLGLAQVHSIIESHGGKTEVESELGKGTRFTIYLPKAEGEVAAREKRESMQNARGHERIMVVDDEVMVANLFSEILEDKGYISVKQNDPIEALEMFRSDPDAYDLIILDQKMPKMKGETLAQEMLSINKSQPIILCSGFIDMVSEERAYELGIRKCLIKPIPSADLLGFIRETLDSVTSKSRSHDAR